MYESFYGLKTKPFSMLPDPDFLYLGKKHRVALTLLEYALMNNAGFCVITGEIGAGKTTLLRKLLASIEENITIGMITNTHQSFGELLDWVLSAFGIHQSGLSKVEMHQRFVDFLLEQYAKNKTTLLIVDEAQNMPATTLEELRMLSNINSEKDLVLQVILAGQPDLRDTLRKPELTQFAQRISVDFHLDALNSIETCHYIQHRLVTAGATNDIFTPEACRLIGEYSGGVPRLINLLCDTALVYGFADQAETIDADLIEELVSERMEHSILPLVKIDRSESTSRTDNDGFPWINPKGGTKGLKPAAEKKTVEKAATEIERAQDNAGCDQGFFNQAEELEADSTVAEAPLAKNSVSKKIAPIVQIPDEADIAGLDNKDSAEKDWPALFSDDNSRLSTAQGFVHSAAVAVPESIDAETDKAQFGNRMILFALFVLALFLALINTTFNYQTAPSAAGVNEPADIGIDKQQDEVEVLKQDLVRMQQQAEDMQRERDAALAKARLEEEQRTLQAQAALEAAKREKEAVAAAELAAEKALKAKEQAEALKKKQRLEKRRLHDEWKHLEQERQKAELEQQLLEEQRQTIEQERNRLIKERAGKEMRILP